MCFGFLEGAFGYSGSLESTLVHVLAPEVGLPTVRAHQLVFVYQKGTIPQVWLQGGQIIMFNQPFSVWSITRRALKHI